MTRHASARSLVAALAASACLLPLSCGEPEAPVTYAPFGAAIIAEGAVPVEDVIDHVAEHDGSVVTLSGVVREVCQNKGCWMTLDGGEGKSVRVTFRDYGYFVPKDIAGRSVILSGTVRREELSVETLRHYARDAGKSDEEIASIDSPDVQITVVADGVLVAESPTSS